MKTEPGGARNGRFWASTTCRPPLTAAAGVRLPASDSPVGPKRQNPLPLAWIVELFSTL
ncbi:hypothetical protein JCGZ_01406 [Jatropha curcas]|uniref:Uncharacterized protein n=1 Tax=Jatropha curcas TaxID=180498 RepID=A0A067L8X5_JATCU|nr:hypothetical protein JCGZ_01406 [Jatropha curcas]